LFLEDLGNLDYLIIACGPIEPVSSFEIPEVLEVLFDPAKLVLYLTLPVLSVTKTFVNVFIDRIHAATYFEL
jgi:hypothetical protein